MSKARDMQSRILGDHTGTKRRRLRSGQRVTKEVYDRESRMRAFKPSRGPRTARFLSALALGAFCIGVARADINNNNHNNKTTAVTQNRIDAAVAKVKPALVRVHVVTIEYRQGREIKYESSGSG